MPYPGIRLWWSKWNWCSETQHHTVGTFLLPVGHHHSTFGDFAYITIEGGLHPSVYKLSDKDYVSLQLRYMSAFLNFSVEPLERLSTTSPFLTMSHGLSSPRYTFPSPSFTQIWKISCRKVAWNEALEPITYDSLDSAKERIKASDPSLSVI